MADNNEERKIKILLDAVQPNASIKEMTAGAALMNNQLAKMSADDPGRAKLQDDFARLSQRIKATGVELRTVIKTEEELADEHRQLAAAAAKVNQENADVVVNGKKVTASFTEMKLAANLLEKELHELSADDPNRAKLLKDFHALQDRIGGVKHELNGMKKGLGDATESGGFFKQTMASALGVFTGASLLEVAQGVGNFLTSSREEFQASARVTADLNATLQSTRMAAGLTADEITRIGEARAKVTLFDDDDTNRASSLLLTFTNIKKGVFEEAVPAIQDLAQKMAGDGPADLKGASIQVGKALNDPIKGITALSRVGVSFTEQQKEQITAMVKAGDTAGAQRIILAELNKEFGGSAEAARKAAGGVATLSMRYGEFKEQVGEKVSAALNMASQWFGRLLDKSQPVVDVFVDLWEEAAKLYSNLYDIAEGLGLVSENGDSAGFVAKTLTFLFTLLLAPIKAVYGVVNFLADSFITLYNKSEVFRGSVGGLVEVFKQIGVSALNFLGGVGDLLIGIFTLDTAKIKSGLKATFDGVADLTYKSGINAAENFAKGYADSKDKRIVRKSAATAEATEQSGGGTPAAAEAPEGPSTKDVEKAAKERKKAQDMADKERLEAIKAWVKEEGQLMSGRNSLLTQLGERAMNDEMARREQQRQKLFDDATKKVAQLTGTELDYTEQVKAIVEDRDLQLRELAAKYADDEEKRRQQGIDTSIQQLQAEEQEQLARLELALANGVLNEQAYQDAVFAVKQAAFDRELALIRLKNGEESVEYKKLATEKLRSEADYVTKKKKLDEGLSLFEKGLQTVKKLVGLEEVSGLAEVFGKKSVIYKTALAAQKAIAIAEIGMSLPKQMAANAEAGAKISAIAPPVSIPLGTAYTIGTNILAGINAAAGIAKISGFSFRSGGRTSGGGGTTDLAGLQVAPSGKLLDAEGFAVAGLVHENEYVIPEWMRADPKVAQMEQYLETRRLRGYLAGGPTSQSSQPVGVDVDEFGSNSPAAALLQQLLAEQREQNERMNTWARELKVINSLHDLDQDYTTFKRVNNGGIGG
ncbi:hypothetical protein [Hymenobacter algoricola]|uniref:Phage tail tape measure protein n=1 Tax=Hymenobacter algoricola TaxID=486267 RepID=A0ABP7NU52_9BACT